MSEVPDTGGFIGNGSTPRCLSSAQTNFLESKPRYVCCILNMFSRIHEVPKGYLFFPPPQSHTHQHEQKYTHACTLQFIYLFSSQAVPGTDGQFHGHVCELLGWVNQTVLWGERRRERREREEASKGRGQSTSKSGCVVLLRTQLLISKLSVSKLNFKAELTVLFNIQLYFLHNQA